jgi:Flp pilus assembly protein TadG
MKRSVSADHSRKHFAGDQRGTSAIEFAIVAPLLVGLLVAIITFGWAMNCIHGLRLALEESARALQLNNSLTEAQLATMVRAKLQAIGDPDVTVTLAADTSVPGVSAKRISGVYNFSIALPFLPTRTLTYSTSVVVPLSGV